MTIQDKNFTIRLKAAIERRMKYAGKWDGEEVSELLDNLTINYLQGEADDPEWQREADLLYEATRADKMICAVAVRYRSTLKDQKQWLIEHKHWEDDEAN